MVFRGRRRVWQYGQKKTRASSRPAESREWREMKLAGSLVCLGPCPDLLMVRMRNG